jgi:hypothetical protein
MSLQLLIAFRQPLLSKSGQNDGHPIEPSGMSSPLPQILSSPPHDFAMLPWSFVASTPVGPTSEAVFGSVMQFVDGGSEPFTLAPSHFCSALVRPCTYFAEAFARSRSHLSASARAVAAPPASRPTATMALTSARTVM